MGDDLSPAFVAASMIRVVADEFEQGAAEKAGPRGHAERLVASRLRQKADELEVDAPNDGTERTECWRCGYQRPTFESCPACGGSCKPLSKREQQEDEWEGPYDP